MVNIKRRIDPKTGKIEEAFGRCESCRKMVDFLDYDDFATVECGCGALYNPSGQRLVPRDQWEEPLEED